MPAISVSSIPIPFQDKNVVLVATEETIPVKALIDTDGIFMAANDDGDYILTSD